MAADTLSTEPVAVSSRCNHDIQLRSKHFATEPFSEFMQTNLAKTFITKGQGGGTNPWTKEGGLGTSIENAGIAIQDTCMCGPLDGALLVALWLGPLSTTRRYPARGNKSLHFN